MAEKPTPPESDPSTAEAPAAAAAAAAPTAAVPAGRRTVTLSVVPFAIIGSVLVALVFFGGGVAVGLAVGDHHARVGLVQPFQNGFGPNGGQNGFGPDGGRDGGRNGGFDGGFNGQPGQPGQPGQGGGQPGGQDGRPIPAPTPTNG